jgi:hypothetical protein
MGIKVEGLDEFIKSLDNMAHSITEDGLKHYCNEIKSHAIAVCQISNDDFTFEPISQDNNVNINFQLKDKTKWPCIRQIISSKLNSIPIPAKSLFEIIITETDKRTNLL